MLLLLLPLGQARADEGMWLLKLMERQHLADSLRQAGLAIPASELYSETSPSMRDCIGIFGSGCTGEVVSGRGLVMTNNHCGFAYVHAMSTMEHNYLQEGFFAHSEQEELPCPHLTFTFVRQIDDATELVERAARRAKADAYTMQSQSFLEPLAQELLAQSSWQGKKGMQARIVPYFGGNQFYLFLEQTYQDVRLVVNPPQQVAQFGFNQDNWMWPRHNADFAVFRIYADRQGEPAAYAADNAPLACQRFLPISLRGVEQGDYTMVMGFPGRTSRYLTVAEVKQRTDDINAPVDLAGNVELTYMKALMDADPAASLRLAEDYMSLGNTVKNFGGMNQSVRQTHLLSIKQAEEARLRAWCAEAPQHGVSAKQAARYAQAIDQIDALCRTYADSTYHRTLLAFTLARPELQVPYKRLTAWAEGLRQGADSASRAEVAEQMRDFARRALSDIDLSYEAGLRPRLVQVWNQAVRDTTLRLPAALADSVERYSLLRDSASIEEFLARPCAQRLLSDPLARYQQRVEQLASPLRSASERFARAIAPLHRTYTLGLCQMAGWTKAPDANFTLRMTYGHVRPYEPRDAVSYHWQTTLEGMMEKENPRDPDYVVDPLLREHFLAKNYGPYAREDGRLATCFLSDNDITGGNSGSGVYNAHGELVGLAFDGNIESLSSDLRYNPRLQRCINVDIRYVLFVIDTYGGAKYLLPELELRK